MGVMTERQNLIAYLATLAAIVAMAVAAATVCLFANVGHDLAQIVAALGFIGAATSGLIGVLGTFKGRQSGFSEDSGKKLMDKIPPTTETETEKP